MGPRHMGQELICLKHVPHTHACLQGSSAHVTGSDRQITHTELLKSELFGLFEVDG